MFQMLLCLYILYSKWYFADCQGYFRGLLEFKIFNSCIVFREIIEDIDEDGSGLLEFGEFCQLAAKFLVEEDEEALKKELKEAFRIYDKV